MHKETTLAKHKEKEKLVEYKTNSGAMILLNKNNNLYTWTFERMPRKLHSNSDKNAIIEKRRRKRKNRAKKRKENLHLKPNNRPNLQVMDNVLMPVVKIMQGDEVICPGVVIHQYFILAAAHCVQKMTGLYIYGRQNMSIYQVYIFNHQSAHPLALIQTLTKMPQPNVCFDDQGTWKFCQ